MGNDTASHVNRAPSLDRGERPAYRVEAGGDPSVTVPRAVAAVTGCEPTGEEFVLYDAVDPDALAQLFSDREDGDSRTRGRVVFELMGCRVEVRADGDHVVHGPAPGTDDARPTSAESA